MNERTERRGNARPQRTNDVHRDSRRHAVSTSLRLVDRVKKQTDGRMNGQTPGIEFDTFWPLNVTPGGNNFNDFPDNQLTKFRVFIG